MALATQYELFEDLAVTEVKTDLAAHKAEVKESIRKTQKSLFGKMGDMSKMLFELYHQNEQLHIQYADALSMISSLVERIEKLEKIN